MSVKQLIIKCMGPLYPILFKTKIRNRKLEKEVKNLTFQFKRLLDADVKVESHIGAGTVVTITIPPAAV